MYHLFLFLTIGTTVIFIFTAESLRTSYIINIVFLIILCCLSFILALLQVKAPFLSSLDRILRRRRQWSISDLFHKDSLKGYSNFFHKVKVYPLGLLTLLFSLCILAPLPFYLVDDMIRHIHDGYYLLQGVDVYSIAPEKLPSILGQKPNHPHLATIYLPFTQMQAMLGATFSVSYGFRIIYISICVFLLWGIYKLTLAKDITFYLYIFFSPAFLILLCSHHADVQGFLLASFIGLWIKRSYYQQELAQQKPARIKPHKNYRRVGAKSKHCLLTFTKAFCNDWGVANYLQSKGYDFTSFAIFSIGFLAALLPGLKPEGAWWLLCFTLAVFAKIFLSEKSNNNSKKECLQGDQHDNQASSNTKKKQLQPFGALRKSIWKQSLLWLSGVIACLFLQFSFAYHFLWLGPDSFVNFKQTVGFFVDWFLAYNPILLIRTTLYESNMWRPEIFALYRQQIFILGTLCFFLLPGLYLRKIKTKNGSNQKSSIKNTNILSAFQPDGNPDSLKCINNTNILSTFQLSQILVQSLLLSGLLVMLFSKGVWYPWYFLWLLPALGGGGILAMRNRFSYHIVCFLMATFPLFYLPFVLLRAHGLWQFQSFYVAYGISILVWVCLTRWKRSVFH